MMPVQLTIENGTFENSIVDVKKNGEEVLSITGEKNMRLKLEYGNEYLLSFSKPGYITKKVEVNTTVAEEHGKQGFEPYKIGVRLFKQYDGINIVVYNQPVAKIKYLADLDEFNYDTDYTKSILSVLTETENKLIEKAKEEREMIKALNAKKPQLSVSSNSDNSSSSTKENNSAKANKNTSADVIPSNSVITGAADNKTSSAGEGIEDVKSQKNKSGNDEPHPVLPSSGAEKPSSIMNSSGTDKPSSKLSIASDQDTVHFSSSTNINELPVVHFNRGKDPAPGTDSSQPGSSSLSPPQNTISTGAELPKVSNARSGGKDVSEIPSNMVADISKTIDRQVESNRVITTIRVNTGDHVTEYRHVVYNWGGEYFFINNTTPLSPHLFNLYTGE